MSLTRLALFVTIAGLLPLSPASGARPDPQEKQPQPSGGVVVPQQPTFKARIDLVTSSATQTASSWRT